MSSTYKVFLQEGWRRYIDANGMAADDFGKPLKNQMPAPDGWRDVMQQQTVTQSKQVKIPGPDHPITIERNSARVVVTVGGRVVADTGEALTLREASYLPVQYIPRKDVDISLLERTNHVTYCPYKGD